MQYDEWFQNLHGQSVAWEASDFDRLQVLDADIAALPPDEQARFMGTLCERSGQHVKELGPHDMGQLLWYAMGSGASWWSDIGDVPIETAESAVLAVRDLYEQCFLPSLTEWRGPGTASEKLETACYMLWDMDGGLSSILYHHSPRRLAQACYEVLEFALSLPSEACWESALHGLGHVISARAEPGRSIIDRWRKATPGIPPELEQYAQAGWSGCVQ